MRRTPAATPVSLTILNSPISLVLRTCVPPHSSTESPGIVTTRTTSPYFSPNSAIAPARDRFLRTPSARARTGTPPRCRGSRAVSISLSCSGLSGPWCVKSKRRRSGATSDPAWCTCSPSTLAQRRVQQVRRRVIALGVAAPVASARARPPRPNAMSPVSLPTAAVRPSIFAHRRRRRASPSPTISPLIGDLPARLGVERRLAQQHGDAPVVEAPHGGDLRLDLDACRSRRTSSSAVRRPPSSRPALRHAGRRPPSSSAPTPSLLRLALLLRLASAAARAPPRTPRCRPCSRARAPSAR